MSILNVEHLTHGFGDRAIFEDVSFRLLKGEHIGLVGANGEGKSTFMSIVTGKLQPDEGTVEWARHVSAGYLDQHAHLTAGMTIEDVLASAFDHLYQMEERCNELYGLMADCTEEEMMMYMEETGTLQELLTAHDFYTIDAKISEVARALGLADLGLDRDATELSGGQRTKVLLGKLLLEKPEILLLDEPTNYLDKEHITWLQRYLQEYENAFVLISLKPRDGARQPHRPDRFKRHRKDNTPEEPPGSHPLPSGICRDRRESGDRLFRTGNGSKH